MSNSKPKLLVISYDYPPSTGGIARLCHEIVTNLKVNYSSVDVLTIDNEIVSNTYNSNEDVRINTLPRKRILSELKALQFLLNWKHKKNTDVICGTWHPDAALAILAGFKNVFTLVHGTELLFGKSKFRKYFWLPIYSKWVLNTSKKVIANSNYTKRLVQSISSSADVKSLSLGVNVDFFKPINIKGRGNKLKICTVSRILKFKGHDFILDTLSKLPKHYRDQIEWHIAGAGPYLEELKDLVNVSNLLNQVFFHGFVPDQDLPRFYNSCDLFILPTRQAKNSTQVEGFGLVFLEAQSCGLPVIGTNTGGIPDAIDHGNGGWLIEQDDSKQLSESITSLLDDDHFLERHSLLARKRIVANCSWQNYSNQLMNYIE